MGSKETSCVYEAADPRRCQAVLEAMTKIFMVVEGRDALSQYPIGALYSSDSMT